MRHENYFIKKLLQLITYDLIADPTFINCD